MSTASHSFGNRTLHSFSLTQHQRRFQAAYVLGQLGDVSAIGTLRQLLLDDPWQNGWETCKSREIEAFTTCHFRKDVSSESV